MVENWGDSPATDKQRKFLFALFKQTGIDYEEWEKEHGVGISELTRDQISKAIDKLQAPKKPKETVAPETKPQAPDTALQNMDQRVQEMEKKKADLMERNSKKVEETAPAKREVKNPMIVGTAEDMAIFYGIPTPLANMFFMTITNRLYIKNPGLLYLAGKKGYARISTSPAVFDPQTKEWKATTEIYPVIPLEVLKALGTLDKEVQKFILEKYYGPTVAEGRASSENVENSRMRPFYKEMAETRSANRALRPYTGYGGTSYEEMPQSTIEGDVQ